MGRFRSKRRFGAWVALIALALNLAVAFGHHHFHEAVPHGFAETREAHANDAGEHDHDRHEPSAHLCLTCVAVTAIAFVADLPAPALQSPWTKTVLMAAARQKPRGDSHLHFEARAPPRL